jgi:ABC-type uncharacterized transport system fused permease/ATPase subunit
VSDQKRNALGLLAATLLLTDSIKGAGVVFSYVNRDMMTALTGRNAAVFFHNVLLIVAYSLVAAPIMAVDGYVQGRLMIKWRQWLTTRFLDQSLRDRTFYRITADPSIDNPDQRISEDLNAFPASRCRSCCRCGLRLPGRGHERPRCGKRGAALRADRCGEGRRGERGCARRAAAVP